MISFDRKTRNDKPVPAVMVPVVAKKLELEDQGIGETAGGVPALHRTPVVGTWRWTKTHPVQRAPSVSVPLGEATLPRIETGKIVTILPVGNDSDSPIAEKNQNVDIPPPVQGVSSVTVEFPEMPRSDAPREGLIDTDIPSTSRDAGHRQGPTPMERIVSPALIVLLWRQWLRGMRRLVQCCRTICRLIRNIGTCRLMTGTRSRKSRGYNRLYRMWRK